MVRIEHRLALGGWPESSAHRQRWACSQPWEGGPQRPSVRRPGRSAAAGSRCGGSSSSSTGRLVLASGLTKAGRHQSPCIRKWQAPTRFYPPLPQSSRTALPPHPSGTPSALTALPGPPFHVASDATTGSTPWSRPPHLTLHQAAAGRSGGGGGGGRSLGGLH